MNSIRPVMLGAAVILVVVALWQFSQYTRLGAEVGFTHLIIAVICLVAAMACGVVWFLTKPKENMEDISITKI
jgi:hypothetical protein